MQVSVLDSKKAFNVNIFLKQFRSRSFLDIVRMIRNYDASDLGSERLKAMQKILPDPSEVEMLKQYDGEIEKLNVADRFLLEIMSVPK